MSLLSRTTMVPAEPLDGRVEPGHDRKNTLTLFAIVTLSRLICVMAGLDPAIHEPAGARL